MVGWALAAGVGSGLTRYFGYILPVVPIRPCSLSIFSATICSLPFPVIRLWAHQPEGGILHDVEKSLAGEATGRVAPNAVFVHHSMVSASPDKIILAGKVRALGTVLLRYYNRQTYPSRGGLVKAWKSWLAGPLRAGRISLLQKTTAWQDQLSARQYLSFYLR